MTMAHMIHPLADVQTSNIGNGTKIWQFSVVLSEAKIGSDCNICANTFIENDVVIGDNVTVKCGVQLWDGVTVKDNVFIGPNVTFTNDLVPRSKQSWECLKTVVEEGASIGANSTIICGHTIGKYAFIGAGSVVTKDIPDNTVWMGNPVRMKGYITNDGIMLDLEKKDKFGNYHEI